MARKNQKLINYHTGKKTEMPGLNEVDYGEIVVRHNAETPELLIKVSENSFGVFQASGAVQTAIDKAVSDAKSTLDKDISDLQTSLSGHVATFEQFQTNVQNTYATKTELGATSGSITTAYTAAIGAAKKEVYDSATTFATNAVNVAKTDLNGSISSLETSLSGHVADFDKFKGDVEKTYATKEELKSTSGSIITAIGAAKDDVYSSATTFATSAVTVAKGELNSAINAVASNVETLSGAVSSITENYVTTGGLNTTVEELEGKISSAKTEAIGKASGYTDTQIAAAKEYSDGKLSAATETLKGSIADVKSDVTKLSGNVETAIDNLESTLTETINKKVAVAYRYQGTVTNYADLPTSNMSSGTVGYVYNVENANGNYPAGTNYAWNGTEWDALGGSVDLSPYATTTYVDSAITKVNQTNTNLKSDIDSLSSATKTLIDEVSAATKATYATKTELEATSGSIITAYKKAVADAKLEAIGTASGYTDAQVLAAKNALKQSIETVDGRVTELSGVTETVKATADSAVQTASIVDGDTCKVSVNKVNTELKFNFENLVVDCGEF